MMISWLRAKKFTRRTLWQQQHEHDSRKKEKEKTFAVKIVIEQGLFHNPLSIRLNVQQAYNYDQISTVILDTKIGKFLTTLDGLMAVAVVVVVKKQFYEVGPKLLQQFFFSLSHSSL